MFADSKDWTWVTARRCDECSFDASGVALEELPGLIRSNAAAWGAVLAGPGARIRPDESTWSPLEYAAHVRDVCRVFERRLQLLLSQDDPVFEDWDQDAAARDGRYADQDPTQVGMELVAAAGRTAAAFGVVESAQAERSGRRGDGAVFTVLSLGRYFMHDLAHHLHDVHGD